jgi:hypothetical protein
MIFFHCSLAFALLTLAPETHPILAYIFFASSRHDPLLLFQTSLCDGIQQLLWVLEGSALNSRLPYQKYALTRAIRTEQIVARLYQAAERNGAK